MKIKERYITRTITVNKADCTLFNMTEQNIFKMTFDLPMKMDEKQALAWLRENEENEVYKFLSVDEITFDEALYSMKESDFIFYGQRSEIKAVKDFTVD